jgi:hypothetical protein
MPLSGFIAESDPNSRPRFRTFAVLHNRYVRTRNKLHGEVTGTVREPRILSPQIAKRPGRAVYKADEIAITFASLLPIASGRGR